MDLKDQLQEERRGPEGALPEDGPVASAGHLPPPPEEEEEANSDLFTSIN